MHCEFEFIVVWRTFLSMVDYAMVVASLHGG